MREQIKKLLAVLLVVLFVATVTVTTVSASDGFTGFGNIDDGKHPRWQGDFNADGRVEILLYYTEDANWWLGQFGKDNQLTWKLAGNTGNFGQVGDGRPIWVGNFAGTGKTDILFYYPGDSNWWLGQFGKDNQLTWKLAGNTGKSQEILAAHNKYRNEVGVPPLIWDGGLAADAQKWADHLNNDVHHLQHSNLGHGENLAQGNFGGSWTAAIDYMASEKKCFKNGVFPDIYNGQCNACTAQNWQCAGHYSQIIWSGTKKVGAARSGEFWVFEYDPPGNFYGQKAY